MIRRYRFKAIQSESESDDYDRMWTMTMTTIMWSCKVVYVHDANSLPRKFPGWLSRRFPLFLPKTFLKNLLTWVSAASSRSRCHPAAPGWARSWNPLVLRIPKESGCITVTLLTLLIVMMQSSIVMLTWRLLHGSTQTTMYLPSGMARLKMAAIPLTILSRGLTSWKLTG
jgi:hypothetical protein